MDIVVGIGDVGFGLTKVLREPQPNKPTLLGLFGVTAPMGKADFDRGNITLLRGIGPFGKHHQGSWRQSWSLL